MKPQFFSSLPAAIAVAAGLVLGATSSSAAVTYSVGDLLLGFHTAAGTGSGTSFVVNLGSAASYKTNPGTVPAVNDLNAVLTSTYGNNWFSRTDLYWGIAGVRDSSPEGGTGVINGDAKGTIYISRAASAPGASTAWSLASGSTVISAATSIVTMQGANGDDLTLTGGFEGSTEAANTGGRGVLQDEGTAINSWDEFNPIGGAAFGGILTGGVQGPLSGTTAYLDLYRVVGRPDSSASPNDAAGAGRYITTFSLNSQGIIAATAVPEPGAGLAAALVVCGAILRRRRNGKGL
jgi:hypothetical protein